MKLCLVTPELPPYRVGGIGTYVLALAEEFGRLGHDVDVVGCDLHPDAPTVRHPWGRSISLRTAAHPLGLAPCRAIEDGVRWMYRHNVPGAWRVYNYAAARSTVAAALVLRRFVRRRGGRYDVIECSNWSSPGVWFPRRLRGAHVARLSTSAADVGRTLAFKLERLAVRRADVVAAHSNAMARKGEALYDLPAGSVRTIPLGLPDGPVDAPPDDGTLRLVTVGRAEDRKGTDLLLAALAAVLPEHPRASFSFVGPGLPAYLADRPAAGEAWRRLVSACPGRVADLGRISDAERERAVGQAHWLVAPSRFESFGLVAVEAMRAGTPVIYSTAGGLEEVGCACASNVAVNPADAADLTRALAAVCRAGPGPAVSARAAARAAFEGSFSAAVMADRTLALYREALEKRA
jgi:glycosyltransferase involved in cell wall biosynthesis